MDSPAAIFDEYAARSELAYQVDADGRPLWPPSVRGREWRVSAGLGTVYATTTMHRPGEDPEDLSLVDLDEGFRIMSRVIGVEAADVAIGMRVRLTWEDGVAVFEPAGEPA